MEVISDQKKMTGRETASYCIDLHICLCTIGIIKKKSLGVVRKTRKKKN
jgi:hypothetical protein